MEVIGLRTTLKYVCGANTSTQRNDVILQAKRPSLLAIVAGDIMKRYLHMWNTWREDQQHQPLNPFLIVSWAKMIIRTVKDLLATHSGLTHNKA
jgi:hypothetical protein